MKTLIQPKFTPIQNGPEFWSDALHGVNTPNPWPFSYIMLPVLRGYPFVNSATFLQDLMREYRDRLKSFSVLLSITQAVPGRNTRNLGKGI